MNQALKAFAALVPAAALLLAAAILFSRVKTLPTLMQLLGAGALVVVALCHLFEIGNIFPSMGWGRGDSLGHYIDLLSAVAGLVLFPLGYVLHALERP